MEGVNTERVRRWWERNRGCGNVKEGVIGERVCRQAMGRRRKVLIRRQ
jgi:hypothetical protein